jgi:hypothetical protein
VTPAVAICPTNPVRGAPTAVQVDAEKHETLVTTLIERKLRLPQPVTRVQVPLRRMPSAMPLCSPMPLVPPTAMHSDVEGHDTPWNESPSAKPGLLPLSPDHVVPPFVVDIE